MGSAFPSERGSFDPASKRLPLAAAWGAGGQGQGMHPGGSHSSRSAAQL